MVPIELDFLKKSNLGKKPKYLKNILNFLNQILLNRFLVRF